jgi:CRISPR-associated endonuclease Cas1
MREPVSPVAETFGRDASKSAVLVADGYGIRILVKRGHLVVEDGIGRHRRERRFARATHGLRRIVVVGHMGYVSLEAQRWLADVGVAYLHLETDGRILNASGRRGLDHPALRRAQAIAAGGDAGLAITRKLLDGKLRGQARVARLIGAKPAASAIENGRRDLVRARDVETCRSIEAAAAAAYWQEAWRPIPVTFVRRDTGKVADHWKVFGSRQSSLLTVSSSRRATNPANAILNYLYALGEAEAGLALLAVGLDPGLGFLHVDQKARDSAALDLLEAIRPDIDTYVLRLIRDRRWSRQEFTELRDGTCRLLAPLTHELADTMLTWANQVAPIAEDVASLLAKTNDVRGRLPTPLTQSNRSRGRQAQRTQPARRRMTQPRPPGASCETCGTRLSDTSRRVCDSCLTERRSFAGALGARGPNTGSPERIQAQKKTRKNRRREVLAWASSTRSVTIGRAEYVAEVQAQLHSVPTSALIRETGLSAAYCSRIRRGICIPHERHWPTLLALARGVDHG